MLQSGASLAIRSTDSTSMTDHGLIPAACIARLGDMAHQIGLRLFECGDWEGWRVLRLLRDAVTPAQADQAERCLLAWKRNRQRLGFSYEIAETVSQRSPCRSTLYLTMYKSNLAADAALLSVSRSI